MAEIIEAIVKGILNSSSLPKLIITIIAMGLTIYVSKLAKKKELDKAKLDTDKKRSSDQAGIDVPNQNIDDDYKKSQQDVRDILGKK